MLRLSFTASWTAVVLALGGFTLTGCGGVKTASVSGKITVDGKGVPNVGVTFTPIPKEASPGPASSGVTDADGKFALKTIVPPSVVGAVPGKHRVTLAYTDPRIDEKLTWEQQAAMKRKLGEMFPANARDGSMTFVVPPGGTSEANFDFQSQPSSR